MGILFKNLTEFLAESCETEVNEIEDFEGDEILNELEDLEELDDEICYNAEMVNVICQETSYGSRYLVEYDNLFKLMETYNIDEVQALKMVCEHNLISIADTYLVIESVDSVKEMINEAKCAKSGLGKAKKSKKLAECSKAIKNLKNKGIKLVTKKRK